MRQSWETMTSVSAGHIFGSEDMPAISGRKICRQFRDGRYAGNFGSDICRRFRVGRYAGNFGSEDMPAISGRKKKCRQSRIGTKCQQIRAGKKCRCFRAGIKLPENQQLPENLQVWIKSGLQDCYINVSYLFFMNNCASKNYIIHNS